MLVQKGVDMNNQNVDVWMVLHSAASQYNNLTTITALL